MKLAELQALFQAGVLAGEHGGDAKILEKINASRRGAERATLFGVYQNAYRIRLSEFLHEDHPALRAYLGDESFDALIEDYIAAGPPSHHNARYYTTGLPDFMEKSAEWSDDARAVSLALLERALVDAYDAADAAPRSIEALAAFPAESWPRLTFAFHPSLSLLKLAAATIETYGAAVDDECEDLPEARDGEETVAVWRSGEESAYRELDPDEYFALNEARAGRAFGDICQLAAFQQGEALTPERLAQFLANWFEEGIVTGITIGEAA